MLQALPTKDYEFISYFQKYFISTKNSIILSEREREREWIIFIWYSILYMSFKALLNFSENQVEKNCRAPLLLHRSSI